MCGNSKQTATGKKGFGKRLISFFTGLLCVLAATQSLAGTAYTMTDLGTIGDNSTLGDVINARGQIAGVALTSSDGYHIFLYDHNGMHDLGTLEDENTYAQNFVYAINDNGQVVGTSIHAFRSEHGSLHDLGTLGGDASHAYAINSSGQVVGVSETSKTHFEEHAFLYDNTGMHDLGTLGGNKSEAWAINDNGQIIGISATVDGNNHAFLYDNTGMRDLGTLGGSTSYAYAINDNGLIVGEASTGNGVESHAFLYDHTGMHDLGAFGGIYSAAYAITDKGQIIGKYVTAEGVPSAFLYDHTGMHEVYLGADWSGFPHRINASGQVVGYSHTSTLKPHAFLFDLDLADHHDLNCLLVEAPKGWILTDAVAINDMGWIVAIAEKPNSGTHTFLLKPVKTTNIGSLAHSPACETPVSKH